MLGYKFYLKSKMIKHFLHFNRHILVLKNNLLLRHHTRHLSIQDHFKKCFSTKNLFLKLSGSDVNAESKEINDKNKELMIWFTCTKCNQRSSHKFSRQSYTHGSVAVRCPGCQNLHLIADNLKVFKDEKFNIVNYLKTKK